MKTKRLSPKLRRFAQLVAENKTYKDAAMGVGVKNPEWAKRCGSLWAALPEVKEEVSDILQKSGITAERVLAETVALAFSSVENYVIGEDGKLALAEGAPANAMKAVSSVKYRTITHGTGEKQYTEHITEFRLWKKPEVLKIAGRHVDLHGFWDQEQCEPPRPGLAAMAEILALIPPEVRVRIHRAEARRLQGNPIDVAAREVT